MVIFANNPNSWSVDIAANKLAHREINLINESKTDTALLISDRTPLENRHL